ncbi:MAG: sigma-70 family RNA polymerase sigma factor [Chitinophagaceae bacterium]|nr:MAG: sigma-70 family RNA polymerase sigma factor [Chitinophagaceae bacterium]
MGTYDERWLLQQVAEGNEAAFRELFHRYADLLGTFVLRLTRSEVQAEEIVQDVFLKIWLNRAALASVDNFKVYLFVISRNQTLNALRSAVRQMASQKEWESLQAGLPQAEEAVPEENDGLLRQMESAISKLPPQQKAAWLLSRQEGLSHSQIASNMGLSKETVKKYIMYANDSLRRHISASNLIIFITSASFFIFFLTR